MLHFETVEPDTLELLNKLMDRPYLSTFNLVGGTALALQIGHRKSIDLDLFAQEDDNPVLIGNEIKWEQVKRRIVKSVASL